MYEAAVSLLGPALLATSRGNDEESLGDEVSEPVSAAPYGFFRCLGEDRWCAIAVFDEVQWGALCDVLAMNETVPRGEFSGVISRRRHQAELRTLIETRTSVREALELAQALQKKGVPAAVVQNAENLARDPHLLERGFWTRLTRPSLGECFGDRGAIRSAGEQEDEWQPAPSLGQDNDAVFRDLLGWPPEKIARLREQGVIA
jgi:crotonobetainyl-CoA:carnitine CoA-transferase CaiB-like acyl-CoA transferase